MRNSMQFILFFFFTSKNIIQFVQAIDRPKAATGNNPTTTISSLPTTSSNSQEGSKHTDHFSSFAHNVGDVVHDFAEDVEELLMQYSAFAGKIFPVLSKLFISPSKAKEILLQVANVAHLGEWIMIILIGWFTVPFVKYPYNYIGISRRTLKRIDQEKEPNDQKKVIPFEETFLFQLATHISSAGRIAALVYSFDCFIIALNTLGFNIDKKYSQKVAKAIYSSWMLSRLINWKRYIVKQMVYAIKKGDPEGKKKRAEIANKISDVIFVGIGASFLLDVLSVETGICLKSFFAVGSAGTILVSIASKDVALAIVSGLALQASDKMFEGDTIKFGNIEGTVNHIGLMETIVTDSDEMVIAIPNQELSSSRLINISKIKMSRLKQDLHFNYEDCQKLPEILSDIKREIKKSCPVVVSDGTKPLRAYFKKYADSYLEVEVDVRMRCQPGSEAFKKGTQDVLFAIDRGVRRHNVNFAVVKDV